MLHSRKERHSRERTDMNPTNSSELLREAIQEVIHLPDKDLVAVVEFVGLLKRDRSRPSLVEIKAEAARLSQQLEGLSRAELFKRFNENMEIIRANAIAQGTAIEGE